MSLLCVTIFCYKAKLHVAHPLSEAISCSAGQSTAIMVKEEYE